MQLVKNENQIMLFEHIQEVLPTNLTLVDVISDLLNVSSDAAYRRIRGAKPLDFEEAVLLSKHFKVPLDAFTQVNNNNKYIQCDYTPLNLKDIDNYLFYLNYLQTDLDDVRLANPDGDMVISAGTLPTFIHLPYNELTYFILFSWSNSVYDFNENYDEFVKQLDTNALLPCYEKMYKTYLNTPSSEIWTIGTIDRILTLLNHHFELRHFNDDNFPLLLCEQLLDMINTLQNWADKATKGPNNIPFRFYVSDIDFDNSFILFKEGKRSKCYLKLFTINGLSTTDELFCTEMENWLENTEQRSTLISGASEKERYRFFSGLKQKVKSLIDKIYKSNLSEWSRMNNSVNF